MDEMIAGVSADTAAFMLFTNLNTKQSSSDEFVRGAL